MEKIRIASRKDFEVAYFVGSGAGGQNKQKNHTGVHIKHKESGAIGRNSESRSREQNKKAALQALIKTPKFKFWFCKKMYEIQNSQTIDEAVDEMMVPQNLLIEVKDSEGRWVKESSSQTPPQKQS